MKKKRKKKRNIILLYLKGYKKLFLLPAVRKEFPFVTVLAVRFGFLPATTCIVERLFSVLSLLTYRRGRENCHLDTVFWQLTLTL
jgi:hypothetical protein